MKVDALLEFSHSALASAVKLSQRKQLTDANGKGWKDHVEAQPAGKKLSDPRRYSSQQLAEFLAALTSQVPRSAAGASKRSKAAAAKAGAAGSPGELVKPQKLLKRFLPWAAARAEAQAKPAAGKGAKKAAADTKAAAAAGSKPAPKAVDPVWELVKRTRAHPRYAPCYAFDSYEKGWICSDRPADERSAGPPWRLLAIDCEMCASAESEKELLQVAVVDESGSTLMKELVRPGSEVLDYRTHLTGVTAADLEGVTLTRKAAAKRIAALLTPATVLVGHSLHFDLAALRLDHPLVIDTALIFSIKGLATASPSLKLLAEQLLGQHMRSRDQAAGSSQAQQQQDQQQPHDSVEDASTSMALVKRELQQAAPTPPLEPPAVKVDKADLSKLCVHKLPTHSSSSGDVQASLAAACRTAGHDAAAGSIEAAGLEQAEDSSKRCCFLVFPNPSVADDVFAALPGAVFRDSMGRHSKAQPLSWQGSSHKVIVRKMACHAGLAFGQDAAQDRGAPKKAHAAAGPSSRSSGAKKAGAGSGSKAGGKKRKQAAGDGAGAGEGGGGGSSSKKRKQKKQDGAGGGD